MNDLNAHYRQLLGLSDDWDVVEVDLDLSANRVTIDLQHAGGKLCCPECAQACSRADTAPKRTWRHLDTMQFTTEIRAAVPRSQCPQCGVPASLSRSSRDSMASLRSCQLPTSTDFAEAMVESLASPMASHVLGTRTVMCEFVALALAVDH